MPVVEQPTLDHSVARRGVESITQSEQATDFSSALVAARRILTASTKPIREVYLFTDNQQEGWHFDPSAVFGEEWKKREIQLVVIRPDETQAVNAAVLNARLTSPLVTESSRVNGVASVANCSAAPLHDVLEIKLGDATVANLPVEAGAGATVDVGFEFQMPSVVNGHCARAIAKLQGDKLPLDDQFYFTVPIYQAPHVMIFEGQSAGQERFRSGYFLQRALEAGSNYSPPTLPAGDIEDAAVNQYSAIFLADVASLSDRAIVKLDAYSKSGGTVVFLPGDRADLAALARIPFLPGTPLRERDLPAGRLSSRIMDPGNPVFANTWNQASPFPPLPQRRLIEWKVKPNAQVLVTVADTEAFVLSADNGAGKVLIINASPDRAWGDFPLSPAFLPLIQQIALLSSEHGRLEHGFRVGQPVPAGPALPRDQPLVITMPDGSARQVLLGEKPLLLDSVKQAGFYQVSSPSVPNLLTFEVNVEGKESDLRPISGEALAMIVPHESVAGLDALKIWLAQSRGMRPLWPLLVVLLALAFAAESAFSNLAARNRSQGGDTRIKTGRLNKRRSGNPFRPAAEAEAGA